MGGRFIDEDFPLAVQELRIRMYSRESECVNIMSFGVVSEIGLISFGLLRLDGMVGNRPAAMPPPHFNAGKRHDMEKASGKRRQRQTPAARLSQFTSGKLYLPLRIKSLPAANSPKGENILRVAYVTQFASANFTYHTDQSKMTFSRDAHEMYLRFGAYNKKSKGFVKSYYSF
ncbi:hypothetical protein LXL04_002387 [Taraxacum kok-saghyz]